MVINTEISRITATIATMAIVAAFGSIGGGGLGQKQIAFAQTFSPGIELADELVHEFAPEADIPFHQGLCEAGITTEALEALGGCEILPPLIESDDE